MDYELRCCHAITGDEFRSRWRTQPTYSSIAFEHWVFGSSVLVDPGRFHQFDGKIGSTGHPKIHLSRALDVRASTRELVSAIIIWQPNSLAVENILRSRSTAACQTDRTRPYVLGRLTMGTGDQTITLSCEFIGIARRRSRRGGRDHGSTPAPQDFNLIFPRRQRKAWCQASARRSHQIAIEGAPRSEMIHSFLPWVGLAAVRVFFGMPRIASRQDAMLKDCTKYPAHHSPFQAHDLIRDVHPQVGEIKEHASC